jgi:hypothetical protein
MILLDFLKNLFSRNETKKEIETTKLVIKKASINDIQYIFNSILNEAKNKHFNPEYCNPFRHKGLMQQIRCTIEKGRMPINENTFINSKIIVAHLENQAIGFSWIKEEKTTNNHKSWELYLLSISQSHRKRGHGKKIIEASIKELIDMKYISARLYKNSRSAMKILKDMNFSVKRSNANSTTLLILDNK